MKKKSILFFETYFLPIALIVIVVSYRLFDHKMPFFIDEYGYWAGGAFWAGLAWSEITSITAYYGYGYGIFLAPLLLFVRSSQSAFFAAIILNVVFFVFSYVILLKISEEYIELINIEVKPFIKVCLCVIATTCPSLMTFVHFTLAEVLLTLLTELIVYLFLLYIKTEKKKYEVFCILCSAYAVAVHLRMLALFIVTVVVLIFVECKKQKVKGVISVCVMSCFSIAAIIFLKEYYSEVFASKYAFSMNTTNDFSSVVSQLWNKLSCKIVEILESFAGKLFYYFSVSFLLGFFLLLEGIKSLIGIIKGRTLDEGKVIITFVCLVSLALISLTSISASGEGRFDILMYGRYFENVVPLGIMFGGISLLRKRYSYKSLILISFLYILLGKLVNYLQDYSVHDDCGYISLSNVYYLFVMNSKKSGTILILALITCFLFINLYFFLKTGAKRIFLLGAIIVFFYNLYSYSYNNYVVLKQLICPIEEQRIQLVDYLLRNQDEDIYFFYDGNEGITDVQMIQFMLGRKTVHVITKIENEATVIAEMDGTKFDERFLQEYNVELCEGQLAIFKKKD